MAILSLENVSYVYRDRRHMVQAVKDVSTTFEQGQVYAIMGRSGSGKTTVLSLMAGLALPTEGKVVYNGIPTTDLDRDRYRREEVAIIYQSFNLFPLLTALENVTYPLELRGVKAKEAKAQAAEVINSVGLSQEVHRRYPATLSGGEQQRIAIARSLVARPKVILADEPTGNLDTENGANVISILKGLASQRGCGVIIVTHDRSIAQQANIVLQMTDGRVALEEKPAAQRSV